MAAMLEFSPHNAAVEKRLLSILGQVEELRGRRLLCLYQDYLRKDEGIDPTTCGKFLACVKELGKLDKVAVFVESVGGDIDCTYRIIRALRRNSPDVEILVARWAKSAATFLCLGADTLYMGQDAELGPLDTQLTDPKGSRYRKSALNAFKSLEYLRQYLLETLDQVVMTLMDHGGMDIPFAIEAARPLVADIVGPLYQQVSPHELGEARRHLAVGEEYGKKIMQLYSYRHLKPQAIDRIVERLVWEYPSHGYVIDLEEAQSIGLSARPLDEKSEKLLDEMLQLVHNCYGSSPSSNVKISVAVPSDKPEKKLKRRTKSGTKSKTS